MVDAVHHREQVVAAEFTSVSYRQSKLAERYDAIVIGSGAGGLTAAVLLAKHAGMRVVVLERHYTAGGFTHVFRRPGFEWDVGVHYIGQVNDPESPVRRIFDHLTDARLQWAPMPDVYDRIFIADRRFDFPTGGERFRARMKSYFPGEGRAIDRYLAAVNASARWSSLFFVEKSLPPLLSAAFGRPLRWPFLRYAGRTTFNTLSGMDAAGDRDCGRTHPSACVAPDGGTSILIRLPVRRGLRAFAEAMVRIPSQGSALSRGRRADLSAKLPPTV